MEESLQFEVKTALSREDFQSFYLLHKKAWNRGLYILGRVLRILAAVLGLLLVGAVLVFRLWGDGQLLLRVGLFLLMLALLLLADRFTVSQLYKANKAALSGCFAFYENEIRESAEHRSGRYEYGGFVALFHSRGMYYLYLDKGHAFLLPERCFTVGRAEDFRAFITEKTGLEMKEIK